MKNLLNLSNTWLVDGTFKLSPDIFYQFYTIHVELNGFAPPSVYVLLPNKTEKTYIRMIELLSEETNPNPGKILVLHSSILASILQSSYSNCFASFICCFKLLQNSIGRGRLLLAIVFTKLLFLKRSVILLIFKVTLSSNPPSWSMNSTTSYVNFTCLGGTCAGARNYL